MDLAELIERLDEPSLSRAERQELADELREDLGFDESESIELRRAVHILHEQAHGREPWWSCQVEPCVSLGDKDRGPAPLSML